MGNRPNKGDNGNNPGMPTNNSNGEPPTMPDGMQMPNGDNPGTPPDNSNGEKPTIPDGIQMPNKSGGMPLSGDVVSIMDYLQQRIANIKTQLS